MVVNSELMRHDIQGFGFFGFTPHGVIILGMGILYMLLMRTSLVREEEEGKGKQSGRSTMRDLIRDYRLAGRARRLALRPDSPRSARPWTSCSCRPATGPTSSGWSAGASSGG